MIDLCLYLPHMLTKLIESAFVHHSYECFNAQLWFNMRAWNDTTVYEPLTSLHNAIKRLRETDLILQLHLDCVIKNDNRRKMRSQSYEISFGFSSSADVMSFRKCI